MNNTSLDLAKLPAHGRLNLAELVSWCFSNGVVGILAVFGNSLVIAAFSCFKKLRTRTNYFVVGLAAADIIVGLLSVPCWIASLVSIWLESISWMDSLPYRAFIALDVFSGIGSILHLFLISLERLYAIGWPVRHRISSKRSYLVASSLAWSVTLGTAALFVPKNAVAMTPRFFILLLCFFVPLTLICITYITIWIIVKYHDHDTNHWSRSKEVKLALTLSVVIVLFIAAWTPFIVVNIVAFLRPNKHVSYTVVYLTKLLHYSNSAVNPVVYGYRLPEFKEAFCILLVKDKSNVSRLSSRRTRVTLEKKSLRRSNSDGRSSINIPRNVFLVAENAI